MRVCPRCQTAHPDEALVCAVDGTDLSEGSSGSVAAVSEVTRMSKPKGRSKPPAQVVRDDRAEDAIGRVLGSYKLLECIGRGGMGRVYLAEHVRLGRRVALKLLRPEYAVKRDAVARFFQEAKAVNKIRHRNIVEVTDFIELEDGTTFIIMELLEGVSLGKVQRLHGGLEIPRVLSIVVQVCDALQAAHSEGIVHRDLKPDNIFLCPDGNGGEVVKLLDFGVAKLLATEDSGEVAYRTAAGSVVGTPAYMSPEQAGGMPVDPRSDVYSLGTILYELICGQPVFDCKSFGEFVAKHLSAVPVPPSQTPGGRGISPGLEQIILRCLSKKVEERYAVSDLRSDLLGQLSAFETGLIPPEMRQTLGRGPSGSGSYPLPPAPSAPHALFTPDPLGRSNRPPSASGMPSAPPQQLYPFVPVSQPYPSQGPTAPLRGYAPAYAPPQAAQSGVRTGYETGLAVGDLAGGPPSTARSRRAVGFLALGAISAIGLLAWIVYVLAVREDVPVEDSSASAASPGAPPARIEASPPGPLTESISPSFPVPVTAPARRVKVSLRSEPVPGDVYPFGSLEKVCRTPCELTLDPNDGGERGRRAYMVRREGWHDAKIDVPLDGPDQVTLTATLQREAEAPPKKRKPDKDRNREPDDEEEEEVAPKVKPRPKKGGSDRIDPTDTMNPFGK
jgi:serine/threonine protein kinase